jgi:flagellar biosynthesis protein
VLSSNAKKLVAVALHYDRSIDNAPKIVASGYGTIASQITSIAKKCNIPIESDKELANMLALCEVNSYIPAPAFAAVAQILATIDKYKKK